MFAHVGTHSDTTDADGIRTLRFEVPQNDRPAEDYRYALDHAAHTALGATHLFMRLRDQEGYHPDLVIAHVGWGIGLTVRQIWPQTRYIAYHEWYYTDVDWVRGRRERPMTAEAMVTNRLRDLPISAEFDSADRNWCPTEFQASRFPPALKKRLEIVPDGVDCTLHRPDPEAQISFDWLTLPPRQRLLTYTTRGLEPLRGFPQFMRAVELLQNRREDFETLVIAQDSVSYGQRLPKDDGWGKRALKALDLDQTRLHLHGLKPRDEYLKVLQASTAHVYFTEPFVTSWSLLEAMAAGCLVIGSNTAPVREKVDDMETGILVDMDDRDEVAEMIEWVFDNPLEAAEIRAQAREFVLEHFDARKVFAKKAEYLRALVALD
ncbi:glycosyltransferase [Rhodobacter sp. JA431]|uniref:glycosyltransferase n=1 Tax=Rhodobacter sp. JA431 TaxID=570013 RepID=UPI0014835C67|nr:glycosyltransferase [Rhodobacter sp. JA431]